MGVSKGSYHDLNLSQSYPLYFDIAHTLSLPSAESFAHY
ncbi:hypothetical protein DES40_1816 [Litorimonas taeanensis]|uniref:Uncharacterized protein n=1 Tax=Litorimonas taeanensis TaxID=568099 RepID=A0A420WDE4_9PROT|nr:hypothetical protein DES40_1816 [Litorimonas taeanensis]